MIKILSAPLVHITIVRFGLQLTLFVSGVIQAISYLLLIFVLKCGTLKAFLAATYFTLLLFGTSRMAYCVCERGMLLRFSEIKERETYTGYFQLAKLVGDLSTPFFLSLLLFLGGNKLSFGFIALGMLVIVSLVNFSISRSYK